MKIIPVVHINNGENCGTYSPFSFLSSFTGDINEKCFRCLNWEDDRQVETNLYTIYEIKMPDWMSEEQYLDTHIHVSLKFSSAFYSGVYGFSENQFHRFISLSETWQYFIGWLFTKYANTKNSFMLSIKEAVNNWLSSTDQTYKTPLSNKQFEAATKYCPLYEAKKISTRIYWS